MSNIFILTGAPNFNIYYFDAVFSLDTVQSGNPTEYAVSSGANVADHYVQDGDVVNINASVSAVKFMKNRAVSTDLEEFIDAITALKRSGQPFTVACGNYFKPLNNCLFTNLQMSMNETTGQHSIDVTMSVKQIIAAQAARLTQTPVAASQFKDMLETTKSGNSNAVEPPEQQKKNINSVYDSLLGVALGFKATPEVPNAQN